MKLIRESAQTLKNSLLLFMMLFCITQQVASQPAIKNDVDSVVILYLDWNAVTDANITCSSFWSEQQYVVSKRKDVVALVSCLNNLKQVKPAIMDVRCKMYLYFNGEVSNSVCMDRQDVLIYGTHYGMSNQLFSLINRIVGEYKPQKNRIGNTRYQDYVVSGMAQFSSDMNRNHDGLRRISDTDLMFACCCYADVEGNVLDVVFKKYPDCVGPNTLNSMIEAIKRTIRWNANPERSPREPLLFKFRMAKE